MCNFPEWILVQRFYGLRGVGEEKSESNGRISANLNNKTHYRVCRFFRSARCCYFLGHHCFHPIFYKALRLLPSSIPQRECAPAVPNIDAAARRPFLPVAGLLIAATSWGVIWYPYRVMESAGLPAPIATFFSYLVAIAFAGVVFRHTWREFLRYPASLFFIGLTAGITNVAYLVAIMEAEVVRVVLLFYLAPLWTVPMARLLLRERINTRGLATMLVAMTGAVVMLWRPELGVPLPRSGHEWLGMLGGFCFALCNVLVRRENRATPEAKSVAGSIGVALVALPVSLIVVAQPVSTWGHSLLSFWWLICIVGVVLISSSVAMQYGLTKLTANRAAVILLFELIIAAVAAHYLAGEISRPQEWIGGAILAVAGLVAAFGGGHAAAEAEQGTASAGQGA
jgi:drug/metabolite transporter (DMT)-like permease